MSEYVFMPYPRWMHHEVLPDRIALDAIEAERLGGQGYTREKLEGRDALTVRLEYHRAEVRLLEAKIEALWGTVGASDPAPIAEAAPAPKTPVAASPAAPAKKRSGWPKGKKRRAKEKS